MWRKFFLVNVVVGALLTPAAHAYQPPVSTAPNFLGAYMNAERPLGIAKLTWWGFHVYDAALWQTGATFSYDKPLALHIRYAMAFSAKQLVDSSISEMNKKAALSDAEEEAYRADLAAAFKDVEAGDTITAVFMPRSKLVFYHNEERMGEVADMAFAKRFMDIWLGENTSYPNMTAMLKGQAQ